MDLKKMKNKIDQKPCEHEWIFFDRSFYYGIDSTCENEFYKCNKCENYLRLSNWHNKKTNEYNNVFTVGEIKDEK